MSEIPSGPARPQVLSLRRDPGTRRPVGAQDRAVSFPSNTWEYYNVENDGNYTYYFPLPESTAGKTVDIVVLILQGGTNGVKPEAWMTSYPAPRAKRELVLYE
ncbi:MAG: hypothetical protein ACXVI6_04390 [Candidatus Aminicenantales bacterium]